MACPPHLARRLLLPPSLSSCRARPSLADRPTGNYSGCLHFSQAALRAGGRAPSRPGSKLDRRAGWSPTKRRRYPWPMLEEEMSAKKREDEVCSFPSFHINRFATFFCGSIGPSQLAATCFSSYYVKESAIPAVRHTVRGELCPRPRRRAGAFREGRAHEKK